SALALERGEIEGMSFPWQVLATSQKRWLEEGKVNVLLQTVLDKHPALADVPRMVDLAPDADAERILRLFSSPYSIGRAVMAPPGLPDATVAALRRAFDATLADRDFQAAAAKAGLEIDALPGEQLQALIAGGGSLPPALIERVRRLVSQQDGLSCPSFVSAKRGGAPVSRLRHRPPAPCRRCENRHPRGRSDP